MALESLRETIRSLLTQYDAGDVDEEDAVDQILKDIVDQGGKLPPDD